MSELLRPFVSIVIESISFFSDAKVGLLLIVAWMSDQHNGRPTAPHETQVAHDRT